MKPALNKDTRLCISLAVRPSNIGTRFHNYLYDLLGRSCGDGDPRTFARESQRDGASDTATTAGNECDFSFHCVSLL